MPVNGNSMAIDQATGFITPTSNYSIIGFTAEKKTKLLDHLRTEYNISKACKLSGISRAYFYQVYEQDAEFQTQVKDALEAHLDDAESNMVDMSKKANGVTAAIFLLKNRRKAIYGERISVQTDQPGLMESLAKRISKYDRVVEAELVKPEDGVIKPLE